MVYAGFAEVETDVREYESVFGFSAFFADTPTNITSAAAMHINAVLPLTFVPEAVLASLPPDLGVPQLKQTVWSGLFLCPHFGHFHSLAPIFISVPGRSAPQEMQVLLLSLFLKSQLGQCQSAILITPLT